MSATIRIGGRTVGAGHPAYLVAEIGINHNGDMDLARRTIEAAKAAGADAVKFQNYRTEDFLPDETLEWEYVSEGKVVREPQIAMFRRYELDRERLAALAAHCRDVGVGFHTTPMSIPGVADAVAAGTDLLKNGSDCLGHLPLVRAMGETGLPTVLSTGMGTLGEIDEAVRAFRATGNDALVLLICTSRYPTPFEDVHLRRIGPLAASFGCVVGFSDHTEGTPAAIAAVALGASWIEKHFTLDRDLPGPDHRFSSDPAEFGELVRAVRACEAALGRPELGFTPGEDEARTLHRLSCVAARDLPAGTVLGAGDIAFMRPGTGHPPSAAGLLAGRRLRHPVRRGHVLGADDLA